MSVTDISCAKYCDKWTAVVVFATPPLKLATAIVQDSFFRGFEGSVL